VGGAVSSASAAAMDVEFFVNGVLFRSGGDSSRLTVCDALDRLSPSELFAHNLKGGVFLTIFGNQFGPAGGNVTEGRIGTLSQDLIFSVSFLSNTSQPAAAPNIISFVRDLSTSSLRSSLFSSVVLVAIRPFSVVADQLLGRPLAVEFVVNSKRFRSSTLASVAVVLQIRSIYPTSIFASRSSTLTLEVDSFGQLRNNMSECSEVMIGAVYLSSPCLWISNTSVRVFVGANDDVSFSPSALSIRLWDGSKLFKSTASSGVLVMPNQAESITVAADPPSSLWTYLLSFGISLAALFLICVAVFFKQRRTKLKLKALIESRADSSYDGKCCPINLSQLMFADQEAVREGYFGSICKALWNPASTVEVVVAVKQCNAAQCKKWDMARFNVLVQDSAALAPHPNHIRLLGYCADVENPFVVMEWIQNGSIADALTHGEDVPPHVRLRMAREIAEGLAHLHKQGFSHGSIKNRNILIAQDGTAKLGDRIFAEMQRYCWDHSPHELISIELDPHAELFETLALESLPFVSPELLSRRYKLPYGSMVTGSCTESGHGSVSKPEDVYSLGIVLWSLLNWKTPFDGMTQSHIKSYISEGRNVPLSVPQRLPSGFSSDFVDLMTDCLNANPALRPTSELVSERLRSIDPSTRPVKPIDIFPVGFVSDKTTLLDCMLVAMPSERVKLELMIDKIVEFHSNSEAAIQIIRDCGLTPIEAQSISMYTFSVENGFTWQTSPFFIYNKALRLLDYETIAAWQHYSYFLLSALRKLPNIQKKVYRGLNLRLTQISHLYQKGSLVFLFIFTLFHASVTFLFVRFVGMRLRQLLPTRSTLCARSVLRPVTVPLLWRLEQVLQKTSAL
jgi:serine/threonine protein kinase